MPFTPRHSNIPAHTISPSPTPSHSPQQQVPRVHPGWSPAHLDCYTILPLGLSKGYDRVCETTSAFANISYLMANVEAFIYIKMYWTPVKMLLLADVEYSFEYVGTRQGSTVWCFIDCELGYFRYRLGDICRVSKSFVWRPKLLPLINHV